MLIQKLLAIFQKHPNFIVTQKVRFRTCSESCDLSVDLACIVQDTILQIIGDTSQTHRQELVLHLSWLIGEYASINLTPTCTVQVLYDYDEALELFAYEKMSMASMVPLPINFDTFVTSEWAGLVSNCLTDIC